MNLQYTMEFEVPAEQAGEPPLGAEPMGSLEARFDVGFVAALVVREKQIQQSYRPIIGIHKWFARRPGTVFRNLLLAEFNGARSLKQDYWHAHQFAGVIADPFMGGGTPIYEANRLGFAVVGSDINPMAFWVVRQSLAPLDLHAFDRTAEAVAADVEEEIGDLFDTTCEHCGGTARVKYFIWVKTQSCPACGTENRLFPGYLLAEAERHPRNVVVCAHCGHLNEYDRIPDSADPEPCAACGEAVSVEGPAKKNRMACVSCGQEFPYPPQQPTEPPGHRLWAIEYHCARCKPGHQGRFFKRPDGDDLERYAEAERRFRLVEAELPIPATAIPAGDETTRLHRWGYRYFREMFNPRQRLGLGLLLRRIMRIEDQETRHALLTVFSDFLRYQNMLGRYDTNALKCQDIFSVHGFPVGLIQCENNVLGIPGVGAGAFRHFVEKYRRANAYCQQPFETRYHRGKKQIVPIAGERLEAVLVERMPEAGTREAWIGRRSAETVPLPPRSLDGVFTDPPYFDNVQYAELMDFCYAWLRLALADEFEEFRPETTRAAEELTGNLTMERGLDHFTDGLSRVFRHYAAALKENAAFVFTYHHNDPQAYLPVVVAILDAGLDCTAALPAPAEMSASLHIARTKSSVLDSIFVCRRVVVGESAAPVAEQLARDIAELREAGLQLTEGDIRCLLAGHLARGAINRLREGWRGAEVPLEERMAVVRAVLQDMAAEVEAESLVRQHLPGSLPANG